MFTPSVYSYAYSPCQRQYARPEALLAQRARRAQYLPHEEMEYYGPFGLRENLYLDARRQQALDNERRRREAEAQRYQQQLEELRRRRREHVQHRQHELNDLWFNQSSQEQTGATHASNRQEPAASAQSTQVPSTDSSSLPPTPPVEYSDVHNEAAQQIQRLYRQQRSIRSINNIVSQFHETRNSFTVPQALDFINSSVPSIPSTNENLITVDTTSNVTNLGVSPSAEISAADIEPSDVALSEIELASLDLGDQIDVANAMDVSGAYQLSGPTTSSADDEFVIVKDTASQPSEPTISSADGEFVIIEDGQPLVAAQAETTVDDQVQTVVESSEISSVESNTKSQSEETANNVDSEETTPQLAYNSRNYPLHAYVEKLNVLLTGLDGIESYGSQNVRDRRKEVARSIEKEAERIELLVRDVWRKHSRAQRYSNVQARGNQ